MNPFTHAKLAKEIHHYINFEYDIDLPIKTFVWGNLKPDFKTDKSLHYIDNNLEEALDIYEELNNKFYTNIKDYTLKLGEFFHYIADFFCYAHSINFFKENLGDHVFYEMKAHNKLTKFKDFFNNISDTDRLNIDNRGNLIEFLLYNHKKYLKNWQKAETDYIYTLKVTPVLVDNIILSNQLQAAAY